MEEPIKASAEKPLEVPSTDVQQQAPTDAMRFTTHTGKVFELRPKDVIRHRRNISSSMDGYLVLDGPSSPPPESVYLSPHTGVAIVPSRAIPDDKNLASTTEMKMDYNEYGELVDARTLRNPPKSSEMTPLQILRIIKRAFHHDFRARLGVMLIPQSSTVPQGWAIEESGRRIWRGPLTVWDFTTAPSDDPNNPGSSQNETPGRRMANNEKPPRVLELGCSDGHWCYKLKKENPCWIIEGVDDTDHWTCIPREMPPRDFMYYDYDVNRFPEGEDYFSRTPQQYPEFTKRNLNRLLDHERPLPLETYGLIRAREIFDRVESYKTFIKDLFKLLEPGGVIEFVEIDPRPRVGIADVPKPEEKKSGIAVGWTDKIADRFRELIDTERLDAEKRAPGWVARVNERLSAGLRPRDGVPAANLKDWLSAGGFNDLTETKVTMPVGGETRAGSLMVDFIKYQLELENEMQQLKENLPQIEMDQIYSGDFYINLHLITGRKPIDRRMGDMRRDGGRHYMTDEKYDRMAAEEAEHGSSQWQRARSFRFALDIKLTNMLGNLSTLHGGPDHVAPPLESTGNTPSVVSPNYTPATEQSP